MSYSDTNGLDGPEQVGYLFKAALGFPTTNETKPFFAETKVKANNYILSSDIASDPIPSEVFSGTEIDVTTIGLTNDDFASGGKVEENSTGVIRKYTKLILDEVPTSSGQGYYKQTGDVNHLADALQFNTSGLSDGTNFYIYSLSSENNPDTEISSGSGGNYVFDVKNGVLFVPDYNSQSKFHKTNNKPVFTFYKYIGSKGGGGGSFQTSGSNAYYTAGYVGIGTTNPDAPLHISSTVDGNTLGVQSRIFMRANSGSLRTGSGIDYVWPGYMFSLHTEGHIWGGVNGWIVASDERIKKNFELFDKQEAIDRINKINLYKYQYSVEDKFDYRENEYTVGFKAQEVREHHKIATGLMKEYIGDINTLIENPVWENNKLIYDIDLSGGIYTGFVKFFGCMIEGNVITETKRECIEYKDGGFLFEKQYSQVFVCGREVNDFHNLEKDRIYALHHAGIQYLYNKCELLETENNELRSRLEALESAVLALQNK